jgi:hypothetical protein
MEKTSQALVLSRNLVDEKRSMARRCESVPAAGLSVLQFARMDLSTDAHVSAREPKRAQRPLEQRLRHGAGEP